MVLASGAFAPALGIKRIGSINLSGLSQGLQGSGRSDVLSGAGTTPEMVYPHKDRYECSSSYSMSVKPNGYTKEEMKWFNETKKDFSDGTIK